jgi:bifunctional DNA primase/polymerase-like protein/primase-like protein
MSLIAPSSLAQDIFGVWQPEYAARGLATFPVRVVDGNKVPMTRGYHRTGLRGSTELAQRFGNANAIGIMLNRDRMIVDVDTTSESVLADVLAERGETPLIARTASKGGFHCYYGANKFAWVNYKTARRAIRPKADVPIDYLGTGFVVVPPSLTAAGRYEFIRGNLDDIARLPPFRGVVPAPWRDDTAETLPTDHGLRGMREHDGRNQTLFMAIGPIARKIHQAHGSREQLLEYARKLNAECENPMEDREVSRIVDSIWRMEMEGRNIIGLSTMFCLSEEHLSLEADTLKLLAFLRAHQGPHATFMCANGLAHRPEFDCDPKRIARARSTLIELGHLVPVRAAGRGQAALYRWGSY